MKNMLNENYSVDTRKDDKIFNNHLINHPLSVIIKSFCYMYNKNIYYDICSLIAKYINYKIFHVRGYNAFGDNINVLQDPQDYDAMHVQIKNYHYFYFNIPKFNRPKDFVYHSCLIDDDDDDSYDTDIYD